MNFDLDHRTAIVTGASRGLGAAITRAFLAEGMRVVAVARHAPDIDLPPRAAPERLLPVACDVRDTDRLTGLVDVAVHHFGGLDVVVNNAGIAPAADFLAAPLSLWRDVFEVNVFAAVALTGAAGPVLTGQRTGKIINIGSLSSMRGKPTLAAYSASKGALMRFTEALAAEWAPMGVQVNMVAPGGFSTDAQRAVLDDPAVLQRRLRKIPARRMGRPEEIAPLACYLASPISDFVTGACFVIDGGELSKL